MYAQTEKRFTGPLTIEETRYGDDVLVVSLAGELDLAVQRSAQRALESAPTRAGTMVVIDLTELEFLDSGGVALLYELAETHADKGSLRLLPSRHEGVNRVLELTEVGTVIPIVAP